MYFLNLKNGDPVANKAVEGVKKIPSKHFFWGISTKQSLSAPYFQFLHFV